MLTLPSFIEQPDPDIYLGDNYLVLDFETNLVPPKTALHRQGSLLMAAWYSPKFGYKYKVGSEYEMQELLDDIAGVDFIVCHNHKFELHWLVRCGLKLENVLSYCTKLGEYTIAGNRRWIRTDLDTSAERYGIKSKIPSVGAMMKAGVDPHDMPLKMVVRYCLWDVATTHKLFLEQRKKLKDDGLLAVHYTKCLFTPVLVDIERNGLHIDRDLVLREYKDAIREQQEIEHQLNEITGGINLGSPTQLADLLYNKLKFTETTKYGKPDRNKPTKTWPEGIPKTDTKTIAKLKPKTKKQEKFLELYNHYNQLSTSLSKTIKPLNECAEHAEDGILYANFNQDRTKTHRLSSNGYEYSVQFQNFPRKYKKLFTPRNNGWSISEADGAQLEFRVAAYLGQDTRAMDDIDNGFDVHSFTASVLNDMDVDYIIQGRKTDSELDELRNCAKADTFKPLYGGESGTDKQKEYYAAFKEKYPGITGEQERWIQDVLNTGKLVLPTGLITYFDLELMPSGYLLGSTKVKNLPVQYLATAEIIPIGIIYLWHKMKAMGLKSFVINTIHDSILSEVPPEEEEIYAKIAQESMIDDTYKYLKTIYNIDFNVPLEADVEFKDRWGKL